MAKCILHVGMHKTGTTSIQASLAGLSDDTFLYPAIGDNPNHSGAIYSAFSETPEDHGMNRVRRDNPKAMRQHVREMKDSLAAAIVEAAGRTLVFSGESMTVLTAVELRRMRGFFAEFGYETEVLAYIRPPRGYMSSAFQQNLKTGKLRRLNLARLWPDYSGRFAKFDAAFGRDRVHLVKFDPSSFTGGDVVRDFCKRVGIGESAVTIQRKNDSLPRGICKLVFQYNRAWEERGLPQLNGRLIQAMTDSVAIPDKRRFVFAESLADPILKREERNMAWMERRLGQSLDEPSPSAENAPITSEDDLLAPVEGAAEALKDAIVTLGGTAPAGADDVDLVGLFVSLQVAARKAERPVRTEAPARANAVPPERPHRAKEAAAPRPAALNSKKAAAPGAAKPGPGKPAAKPAAKRKIEALPLEAVLLRRRPGIPLTCKPPPMVNKDKNLVVLWSPKSACTTTYVWFSHISGFSSEVKAYASWPHRHRQEQYEKSSLHFDSIDSGMEDARVLRIIREPYGRAVSIYRHALQTRFADKDLEIYSRGKISADSGYSFQTFLDFVAQLDMRRVDIHFRPQFHDYEKTRSPDKVINISKADLFTSLNDFEAEAGFPKTDFHDLDWLHSMESKRKAKQEKMEGDSLDTVVFTRHQVAKLDEFPSYGQLLTPEAKQKIDSIYKVDFDAYRAYL